jgi:hypothetical protein
LKKNFLYVPNKALKILNKESGKLIKHYLLTLSYMIKDTQYLTEGDIAFSQKNYPTFGKSFYSTFAIPTYKEKNLFKVVYSGYRNKILIQMPDFFPLSNKDWFQLEDGFISLNIDWIRGKMLTISDTDLKFYIYFLMKFNNANNYTIESHMNEIIISTGLGRSTLFNKFRELKQKKLLKKTPLYINELAMFRLELSKDCLAMYH